MIVRLFFVILCPVAVVPFLSVFNWAKQPATEDTSIVEHADAVAAQVIVPFELTSTDERFLQEAKKLDLEGVGNTALGDCHKRLVLSLKKNCAQLDEEQIGKMAVNLLNCQNAIENRPQFPCKASMRLADCTQAMDPNSWTVYQLMTNRALAVCHSVGQQLFRARTEMLVSHLSFASKNHIGDLREMHDWHGKIHNLQVSASEHMTTLSSQHESMVSKQEGLLAKQKALEDALAVNAAQVSQDREHLKDDGRTLLKLTSEVKAHLDSTVSEVQRQEELLRIQRQTMDQTMKLYETALRDLLAEMETKGDSLLAVQDSTFSKVQASLAGIDKVNESLGVIGNMLMSVQNFINKHIEWFREKFAINQLKSDMTVPMASHIGMLALLMIVSSFLQFPLISRILIITVMPLNLYLQVTSGYYTGLLEIVVGLCAVTFTHILVSRLSKRKQQPHTVHQLEELVSTIKMMEKRINEITKQPGLEPFSPFDSIFQGHTDTPDFPGARLNFVEEARSDGVESVCNSDISNSSTAIRCQATTRTGSQCKRMTNAGLCKMHRRKHAEVPLNTSSASNRPY